VKHFLVMCLGSAFMVSLSIQGAQIAYYAEGSSSSLEKYWVKNTNYPDIFYNTKVMGIAVAKSNSRYYTWLRNGKVFSGNKNNMTAYREPYNYTPATGQSIDDIVGIAIHPTNDRVFAWYNDGTYSIGRSNNLDRYQKNLSYSLPPGKSASDIVDMGIAGSSGKVYVWYEDGTVSSGSASDLDLHKTPYNFSPDYPGGCHNKFLQGVGIRNYGSTDRVISLHSYWVC